MDTNTFLPTTLWLLSIIILGIVIFINNRKSKNFDNKKIGFLLNEKVYIFFIIAFGLLIRLYKIGFKPLFLDEWYWLNQAQLMLKGLITSPFGYIGDQPSNFPVFFVAIFLTLLKNGFYAVRLPGVIFSLFNSIFIFLLLKEAFNKKTALIGIALLVTSIWDIHMSQLGWNNVNLNPFLISGSMFFFYKGIKKNSIKDIFLGSVFLGISINLLYIASLNVIVIAIYFLFNIIKNKNKKNLFSLLLMTFLITFIVSSPTYIKIYKNKEITLGRHYGFVKENVKNSSIQKYYYLNQIKSVFTSFVPNKNKYEISGLWGITIEPIIFITFLIGLIIALIKIYKPINFLVITNFIIMFIPVVVLYHGNSVWRNYGLFPSIYILSSIGMFYALSITVKKASMLKKRVIYSIFILTILFSFIAYFNYYLKSLTKEKDISYEALCRKTAEYIGNNLPINSLILLPEENCAKLVAVTLLDKYKYIEYNSFEIIEKQIYANTSIAIVKISDNYHSGQFSKKYTLEQFKSVISLLNNNYKLSTINDSNKNIFSIIFIFDK
jgi:4-amino-4-deoxy-L-arabinose transferase-like glycosyltransferase